MNTKLYKGLLAGLCTFLAIGFQPAQAILVSAGGFGENDCSGYFGQGFEACTVWVKDDGTVIELSPVIAKFNASLDIPASEINNDPNDDPSYPSVDGTEWSFSNTANSNGTGTWTYTPGTDDPGIKYWVAKSSNDFQIWWDVDAGDLSLCTGGAGHNETQDNYTFACLNAANIVTSATWSTEFNSQGAPRALSHLTFYDTEPVSTSNGSTGGGPGEVPEPGVLALLGIGLLGGLVARRRFTKQG